MVAVSMTDAGVTFDPLAEVQVHPAAELFPLLQGAEFDELVRDIKEHGLREPIVFTPDGQLLDGRNRFRACRRLRDEPTTRVEHAEPWAYVISVNVHRRHLSESQRAMIGARIAERTAGSHRGNQHQVGTQSNDGVPLPPSQREAAELLNVGTASIGRARKVVQHGVKGLQHAVEAGTVPVSTAARVASEMEPDQQEDYVRRVNAGVNPARIAPPDTEGARRRQAAQNAAAAAGAPVVGNNISPNRHRHINTPALRHLQDSLDALELVLDRTDGLDPSITNEQAGLWLTGLSKGRAALGRLIAQLKERKESTS